MRIFLSIYCRTPTRLRPTAWQEGRGAAAAAGAENGAYWWERAESRSGSRVEATGCLSPFRTALVGRGLRRWSWRGPRAHGSPA